MANFYMTLPVEDIARQVAILLNNHNRLRTDHTAQTVLNRRGAYFVDVVGGIVIGCSAILKENEEATRQFHLCVHPDFRRKGIGRKLKLASMAHVTTPYVYVTIREDNVASINLNESLGFILVKKDWAADHHVLTFGRLMNAQSAAATGKVVNDTSRVHNQPGDKDGKILFYTGAA